MLGHTRRFILVTLSVLFIHSSSANDCPSLQQVDNSYPTPLVCISTIPGASCGPNGRFAGPCNCTCACDDGWGGHRCDKTITFSTSGAPNRPTSPFGFARAIVRRGKYQSFNPFELGTPSEVVPSPSYMWFQEFNQGSNAMLEYTVEMWILPVLDEALETPSTGFTLWEQRLSENPIFRYNRLANEQPLCLSGDRRNFFDNNPGCDLRRAGLIYTHGTGWTWNYGYQLNNAIRYNSALEPQSYDLERVRVRSGVPLHVAFVFEAVAAGQIGTKGAYDDQAATLYINGIQIAHTVVFNRRYAEQYRWTVGSWNGKFPNATADTIVNTERGTFSVDTSALKGLFIDEFRIWRRPRSQKQIIDNMHQTINPNDPDLYVYWNFDDAKANFTRNLGPDRGPDWNGYINDTLPNGSPRPIDRYLGSNDWSEAIYPLFEESFVPSSTNWTDVAPPSTRLFVDVSISGPPFLPLVFFGSSTALIGKKIYMYGGADSFPFNGAPVGSSELRVFDLETLRFQPVTVFGADPALRPSFASSTIVDGTKIWFFAGSFTQHTVCFLETNGPLTFECPSEKWTAALADPRAGMVSVKMGREVWFFGGGRQQAFSLVGVDQVIRFNLDTYDTRVFTRPAGSGSWPVARIFSCMAPYGDDKVIMYGGITGFQDQGTLKEVWLLDIKTEDATRLWTRIDIPLGNIPTVSGWSTCSHFGDAMIVFSGTTGFGVAQAFALASQSLDATVAFDTVNVFRLNRTDVASSRFEYLSARNGYNFTGGILPIRLGHSTVITNDGSHLIFSAGQALGNRAELGDGAEIWTDRHIYYLRLGCPGGHIVGNYSSSDLLSFNCVPCPVGTYQPVIYGRDPTAQRCLPCPLRTYGDKVGSTFCTGCPIGTVGDTPGLKSVSECNACPAGTTSVVVGGECTVESIIAVESKVGAIVGGSVGAIAAIGAVAGVAAFIILRKRRKNLETNFNVDESQFDFVFLKASDIDFGEELGSGSFGTVFKGSYNGRPVAIKVSRPGVEEALRDFLREAEVMMKVQPHPNVIQLVGVALDAGSALVLLEFVDGGSLDKLLRKGHEFTPEELPDFLQQVVAGLSHIHSSGLVHRDLAARNILLAKDPDTGRYIPKIADFGLSREVSTDPDSAAEGQTKTNFGPVPWMAPEAIGQLKYSPQSDVWSLGVTIWEIVSGLDPSQQGDLIDLAVKIRDNGFHPFIPPFIPTYLTEIFEGCWEFEPANRLPLDQISKLLSTASFAPPPAVLTNRASAKPADKRKTKTPAATAKANREEMAVEVQRLKDRLRALEQELEAVLAENFELEKQAPPTSKKNNGWRVSVKPSNMSNIKAADEVEMQNIYGALPASEADMESPNTSTKKKSSKNLNSAAIAHDESGGYTSIPNGSQPTLYGALPSSVEDVDSPPARKSSWAPSQVTVISPPPQDPNSPYTALPGAPSDEATPNEPTAGYTTLLTDEDYEAVVSPRSGEVRRKKKKKQKVNDEDGDAPGAKSPRSKKKKGSKKPDAHGSSSSQVDPDV